MYTNLQPRQFQHRFPFALKAICFIFALASLQPWPADAAKLKEARVTQVIKDVKLLPKTASPRPAAVSDPVREGTAVRTGVESRAELTFTDQTLARLGANTIFSFDQGTRNLELGGGAMLLRVPKDAGGAQINTSAITAAITGTTMLLEYHPDAYCKFMMLEGVARIFRNNQTGESVLLHPGQMLIVNPKGTGLPEPVDFDLKRVMKTSLLITGFGPLPSGNLIAQEINVQDTKKNEGGLVETNLVIFGSGTAVSLLDPTHTDVLDQANANEERQSTPTPTATPTPTETVTPTPTPTTTMTPTPTVSPTPSKFGTPSVISSPVPYVITSGTTIQTDPSITTNGVTDFGKIYRGPALDGPPSAFLFTATSPFDIALGFDQHFEDVNLLPLAVFKFSALEITGNPTILIPDGGATNLALISVGDITSGSPGGSLTFTGLDSLLLATEDGSITLTSDLSFENIPALAIIARGLGSNLTLDAAISGTTDLFLGAEGNIVADDALTITQTNNGLSLGLFAIVIAGGDITVGNGLSIVNDNSVTGNLLAGGSITLSAGGNLTVNGAGNLTLTVMNNSGGHIGTGGNIFLSTGGDLTAGAIDALINNRDGGTIDDGGNLIFNIGGDLTATGEADLTIDNSAFNGSSFGVGGDIAADALISLSATNVSIGGGFFTFLFNDGGGHIGGDALVIGAISGNFTAGGDLFFDIENSADTNDTATLPGGTIDGNASVTVDVGGNIVSGGLGEFAVLNNDFRFLSGGGTISGNATVGVSAVGISTAGFFQPLVNNNNGSIGGGATVTVGVTGDITVGGETFFNILNSNGEIGNDALSDVTAANFTTGSTFEFQVLNDGGSIGGSALLSAFIVGDLSSTGDAFIQISNGGGTIGADASIIVNAGSFSANSLILQIGNLGGTIGGGSSILFDVGDVNISGETAITIDNSVAAGGEVFNGSAIPANATIDISAGDIATSLFVQVLNQRGGTIGGDATINLGATSVVSLLGEGLFGVTIGNYDAGSVGGDALIAVNVAGQISAPSEVEFSILNNDIFGGGGGTIGGDATIDVSAADLSTAGVFFAQILNAGGGSIGGDATLNLNLAGALSSAGDTSFEISNIGGETGVSAIGGDATIGVTAAAASVGGALDAMIDNTGGTIGGSATLDANLTGSLTSTGAATIQITNDAGSITNDAIINVNAASFAAASLLLQIDNLDGTIGGTSNIVFTTGGDLVTSSGGAAFTFQNTNGTITNGGSITLTADGSVSTQGQLSLLVENYDFSANPAGHIGIGGNISLTTGGNLTADSMSVALNNRGGGVVDSGYSLIFNIGGALTTLGDGLDFLGFTESLSIAISSRYDDQSGNTAESFIGGDANLLFQADSASIGGGLSVTISDTGGTIDGNALLSFSVTDDMTVQGADGINFPGESAATLQILNDSDVGSPFGGTIHGNATILLSATNLTVPAGSLLVAVDNRSGGVIDSDAALNLTLAGNLTSQTDTTFQILNAHATNGASGGGDIGGNASINWVVSGDINSGGDAIFQILNNDLGGGGGVIGSNATINVTANTFSAASLLAQIDNTIGTIGGDATIDVNVTGTANVTGDATIEILGSDGAASAAINVNGGDYDAGGTFLAFIDGDGAITFNNASLHADVLKVGALGTNGVLSIGGGTLSADTTLKLYASGSNGMIDFVSNVTLNSENSSVIIAANTVTINNGVVVTITGDDGGAASVFTNVPNYTGSGGNGSTSGIFGDNGAQTQPLDQAPPFDGPLDAPATGSTTSTATTAPIPATNPGSSGDRGSGADTIIPRVKRHVTIARVTDSNELLDLAERVGSSRTGTRSPRSNATAGRTSRGARNVSLGNNRPLPPHPNVLAFAPRRTAVAAP